MRNVAVQDLVEQAIDEVEAHRGITLDVDVRAQVVDALLHGVEPEHPHAQFILAGIRSVLRQRFRREQDGAS